jgi:hypothetical protein
MIGYLTLTLPKV